MTILQNTLTEPDGTALDGWLDVAVVGNPFRPVTGTEILGPIKDHRFTGGVWSVELTPGLYTVTQRRSDGLFHSRWTADVPDSVSPVWLADCLVTLPGTPTAVPLLGIASTVVDEDGHLQITYTNGQAVDAGLVLGPQGPPYTGSAAEFNAASVTAIEEAGAVAPAGAWNFTQAPTVDGAPIGGTVDSSDISDSTPTGRAVITAASAAAGRTAIGAISQVDGDGRYPLKSDFQAATASSVRIVATTAKAVNNSTVLSSDPQLSVAVKAGEVWQIDAFLLFTLDAGGSSTTDVKMQWSLPAGSTGWWGSTRVGWDEPGAAGASSGFLADVNSATQHALGEGTQAATTRTIVTVGADGDMTLQWAQNTAAAVDLTRLVNSNLMCERLSA